MRWALGDFSNLELSRSTVHRGLDVRMKVGGMEALDLIAALILAATLNILQFPTLFVIGVPAFILIVLYFGKRNKPDGFLVHLIRFYMTPGLYSAGAIRQKEEINSKINEK